MAFQNRIVEFPNRVKLVAEDGTETGPFTIVRDEGTVTAEGTPMTAENLNAEIASTVKAQNSKLNSALTIDASANVHFKNLQAGKTLVKPATAKATTTVNVKFSKTYTKIPKVIATAQSSVPASTNVTIKNVTTSGFTICLYRVTKTETYVSWIAFA